MHKIFTKDEKYSINIYDRKTGANMSDMDDVVCEIFIMKLIEPYAEFTNVFSVYMLSEDGVMEKWNGARELALYNKVKEYSKKINDNEKNIFLELMSLDNSNETDNFDKAEELVRKLDNSNDFLFDKDIKETLQKLFEEHGTRLIWE
ncbi:MAG: hypothetical protein IJH34_14405 [Romboutsia sp.]|nr:hypothetical protein [Romboutsia sp.]